MILREASEEEAQRLREKWAAETKLNVGPEGVEDTKLKTNFFDEMISEEADSALAASLRASQEAAITRSRVLKSAERELAKHFAKLIEKDIAIVRDGALVLDKYSVSMSDGNFELSVNGQPVTKFSANGDAIRSLAKEIAKNPQPKPAVEPITAISVEQRLRGVIKGYIAAYEELKASQ